MALATKVHRNVREIATAVRSGPAARRSVRRRYTFDALRYLVPHVTVHADDGLFLVPTHDRTVAKHVFMHGAWEPQVLDRALQRAPARSVFVDVGANIGTTSIAAARRGFQVLAVEALPDNARVLRANVALNDLQDRVTVVQAAASDAAGTALLHLSAVNSGAHSLHGCGPAVSVPTVRLDDVLAEHDIDPRDVLLWIDVEGHEGAVLAGAPSLCAAAPPAVVEVLAGADRFSQVVDAYWTRALDLRQPDTPAVDLAALRGSSDLLLL